jgi:hypothetical protein
LQQLLAAFDGQQDVYGSRIAAWQALQETGRIEAAIAFVVAVLGSELERESAVAAAVLSRLTGTAADPRVRPPWPWPWDIWEDLYELAGPEWLEILWWGRRGGEPFVAGIEGELAYDVPWRPDVWRLLYRRAMAGFGGPYRTVAVLDLLVPFRLRLALRSPDPITRALAHSALLMSAGAVGPPGSTAPRLPGTVASTMIHGTWGWKGDWWRPRPGSFHDFILTNHRGNLYKGGARFSWSGAYSTGQRDLAAWDFCDWANDMAPAGLETVLAHSYGGEIAARSRIAGAAIDQIVLLSSPVNGYIKTVANDPTARIVDVRLRFDPVLAAARVRQRIRPLPPNVTEVILAAWRLDHGATHKQSVWLAESVAARGGI